ncbi:FAD-dependent oxidoreductase [Nocardioides gansuensis]|uniref:FAD-dependent oxidoreductase n=1 Tax=Nocardioides gansuensis TaxID=2138300 RepID=A0A2T8FDV2_9ACTN|nr:FAD-dependent oxidoreductase [Nocardioides gansuensis]PVG83894.1 FAD-dependent oxidoreductase [Nocardioides gansuensis]
MLTPLWLDRPRTTYPPLAGEARCDVCVVGGGITGLLTALLFARAGKSVILLEARRIGAGTTGHTTAKVCVLQGTRLSRIATRNPPHTLRQYVDANLEGQAWLRRFCEDHGVRHQVKPAYTYATTRLGVARARAELLASRRAGLPVEWTDQTGLPFATQGAIRLDGQVQLHPMELLEELTSEVIAEGGAIYEGTRVQDVERGDELVVRSARATVRAGHVVIATSMPILDRAGFFARLKPSRSYAATFRSSWSPPGMYLSCDATTRSIRSVPEGDQELVLVGGNGHTTGRGPHESTQVEDLVAWARSELSVDDLTHTWSAQDQTPVTALPYAGPLFPRDERLLVATGYDKWGFANAAASALLLSKTVLGESRPPWGPALSSWTPRELTALPHALVLNGTVGVHLARGWAARTLTSDDERGPVCTHLGGVLRWNDAEESWDCPLHGSRFSPDGAVLEGPATRPVSGCRAPVKH